MNIVVIGPGAMGCFLAAALSCHTPAPVSKGQKLHLLDHNPGRASRLSQNGLLFEEDGRRKRCPISATADPAIMRQGDLLLLCVKSGAVAGALEQISRHMHDRSLLICLQNGVSHLDFLESFPKPVAVGVTAQGANLVAPDHVRHAGRGITRLGFLKPHAERSVTLLRDAVALFRSCGIETSAVENIRQHLWTKLMVNVGINALTAIHDCANGQLPENPEIKRQLQAAVREALMVADASGIEILSDDPVALTLEVCRATSDNISSMLQDVRNRRPTEIEAINGAIVTMGRQLGIPVPMNEELRRQVRELERTYLGCVPRMTDD